MPANPNISEVIATAIRNRQREFADNVSNHNALLYKLEEKGNIKPASGGYAIMEEIEWDENSTAEFYSGYQILDTTPQDVLSSSQWDWKQAACQVTANGLETRTINKGKEKMIDLFEARITNAMHSMKNLMATSVYSDGTGFGGKEIGGLALLVADDPTTNTVVGGINQQTYPFWQNKTQSSTLATNNVYTEFNKMWIQLLRGADKPDLIMCDSNNYRVYEAALQEQQRFMSADQGMGGFDSLKFKSADVVYDDQCPADHSYFLNTDYLYLRNDPDTTYEPMPDRSSINQDAMVLPILWCGNLTTCIRRLQGVITP